MHKTEILIKKILNVFEITFQLKIDQMSSILATQSLVISIKIVDIWSILSQKDIISKTSWVVLFMVQIPILCVCFSLLIRIHSFWKGIFFLFLTGDPTNERLNKRQIKIPNKKTKYNTQ